MKSTPGLSLNMQQDGKIYVVILQVIGKYDFDFLQFEHQILLF